jgi:hypothetical protein
MLRLARLRPAGLEPARRRTGDERVVHIHDALLPTVAINQPAVTLRNEHRCFARHGGPAKPV